MPPCISTIHCLFSPDGCRYPTCYLKSAKRLRLTYSVATLGSARAEAAGHGYISRSPRLAVDELLYVNLDRRSGGAYQYHRARRPRRGRSWSMGVFAYASEIKAQFQTLKPEAQRAM